MISGPLKLFEDGVLLSMESTWPQAAVDRVVSPPSPAPGGGVPSNCLVSSPLQHTGSEIIILQEMYETVDALRPYFSRGLAFTCDRRSLSPAESR